MQEIQITRSFRYNSITLPDPHPALGPDQVREFYATQYPELINAVVEGPVTKNAVATYTFVRAAGAKGAAPPLRSAEDIVREALAGPRPSDDPRLLQLALRPSTDDWTTAIAEVAACSNGGSTQMPLPPAAFGLWG